MAEASRFVFKNNDLRFDAHNTKQHPLRIESHRFVSRAKLIKNHAVINEDVEGDRQALQAEIRILKRRNAELEVYMYLCFSIITVVATLVIRISYSFGK